MHIRPPFSDLGPDIGLVHVVYPEIGSEDGPDRFDPQDGLKVASFHLLGLVYAESAEKDIEAGPEDGPKDFCCQFDAKPFENGFLLTCTTTSEYTSCASSTLKRTS